MQDACLKTLNGFLDFALYFICEISLTPVFIVLRFCPPFYMRYLAYPNYFHNHQSLPLHVGESQKITEKIRHWPPFLHNFLRFSACRAKSNDYGSRGSNSNSHQEGAKLKSPILNKLHENKKWLSPTFHRASKELVQCQCIHFEYT